jgi:FkbM family methyltransferase
MSINLRRVVYFLPGPLCNTLRSLRDQIAIRTFRPRIVEHVYGGIPLRIKIADKISARWYDRNFDELPEIAFLKRQRLKAGALVFDLGAHQAVIALLLANIVGESGRIVAVEASKYNFELALENRSLNSANNLALIQAAVSDKSGVRMSFTGGINGTVSSSGDMVLSTSIDTLAFQNGWPDVVMLDVEGSELLALEGASETLRSGADWYVEVHGGCGLESFGGSSDAIARIFRNHGYTLYCQTDQHYEGEFHLMSTVPSGRFFLIAVKDASTNDV